MMLRESTLLRHHHHLRMQVTNGQTLSVYWLIIASVVRNMVGGSEKTFG